jgi:GNAT superfamily N-acetyltransferase
MNSPEIEVSPAQSDELHLVAELRAVMAQEMGENWDNNYSGWRERFVEYFSDKQAIGQSQFFVARAGESVVGIAAVSLVEDYHGYVRGRYAGRVNAVYVAPEIRRRGVARRLMQAGMHWLKQKNCVVVRLNSSAEGQFLYQSLGFKARNEMECYL